MRPRLQPTDQKCMGQQEVHGQEPAGHGPGFWSKPLSAIKESQRE